jgi:TRAP-type C4-dicarboxylate transport system substrate-binding protein
MDSEVPRLGIALAAICAALTAPTAYAAEFELKLAHPLPPVHHHFRDLVPEWSKRISTQSKDRASITQYPSGQLLKAPETFDGLRAGVADIAFVVPSFTPGRFPVLSIAELPFLFRTADSGSKALMDLYATGAIDKELADVKVLYLHVLDLSTLHMRNKPIRRPEDLRGLRMRYPSTPVKDLLSSYGAVPVGIPVAQIYENLEKGVVDGIGGGWDSMLSLRLADLVKHHLDMPVYSVAFCMCMNKRRFESMPADLQQAIMDNSGAAEAARVGAAYDRAGKVGYEFLVKNKHHMYKPSAEEEALWRKGAEPVIEAHLRGLEDKGIKAREYYRTLKEAAAKYEK